MKSLKQQKVNKLFNKVYYPDGSQPYQYQDKGLTPSLHTEYPRYASCGDKSCKFAYWEDLQSEYPQSNSDSDIYKAISPWCRYHSNKDKYNCKKLGKSSDGQYHYITKNDDQHLNVDACFLTDPKVQTCELNTNNQDIINYYDPLRAKLYKDYRKESELNYDDQFEENIKQLFKCCGSSDYARERLPERTCGGYNISKEITKGSTKYDGGNCIETIQKYCGDLDHPERIMSKNSLCYKWATNNGAMHYVTDTLKYHCKKGYTEGQTVDTNSKPIKPNTKNFNLVSQKEYEDACACYMPQDFYKNFNEYLFKDIEVTKQENAKALTAPVCIYGLCGKSNFKPTPNEIYGISNNHASNKAITQVGLRSRDCNDVNIAECISNTNIRASGGAKINIEGSTKCGIFKMKDKGESSSKSTSSTTKSSTTKSSSTKSSTNENEDDNDDDDDNEDDDDDKKSFFKKYKTYIYISIGILIAVILLFLFIFLS